MGKATINLMGGLANQLFEIFFLLGLAKKYDMEVFLPDIFEIPCGPKDTQRHTYYHLFPSLKLYKNIFPHKMIVHDIFGYQEVKINPDNNYLFQGHFQSYKYFQNVNPYDYIILPQEDQKTVDGLIQDFRSSGRTLVAVHVRRGDYLSAQHFHNVLPVSYYRDAYETLRQKGISDAVYVIFSDDMEWCKQNLTFLPDKIFTHNKDYVDLFLMAACDHNIIANSSFSWWGAYLNKNKDKIVVYPSKWFQTCPDLSSVCPPEWIMSITV